jgi:crotonobetainyl-CoA:carnitine CoA-transferase CaiB-like acyl-CoA transferase
VSASILGASTLTSSETLIFSDGSVAPYERLDHEQTGIAPGYAIYQVADGWVAVAAVRHGDLQSLCKVAGANAPDELGAALRSFQADALLEELDRAQVPAERVRLDNGPDFLDSKANRDARLVVSYPQRDWGRLEQIGAFWFLGDLELQLDRAPPGLGEHTRTVLAELGFDEATIENLAGCGAIGL